MKNSFYGDFIRLTIPLVLLRVVDTSINLIDGIMVGGLGEASIAAVGFCNNFYFMFSLLEFGICNGCAIFTAQYWGKQDFAGIRRTMGVNLMAGASIALLFVLATALAPQVIMGMFSRDPEVIRIGCEYLRATAPNYLLTAFISLLVTTLKNLEQAKCSLLASLVGIAVNVFFNTALIYGNFGFPALGAPGSGIATSIARFVNLLLLLAFAYIKVPLIRGSARDFFCPGKQYIGRYAKTMIPVILNEGLYGIGTMLYSVVFGLLGTAAVASINMVSVVQKCAQVFMGGAAGAAGVIIGRSIGAGNIDASYAAAVKMQRLARIVGLIGSGVFIAAVPLVFAAFQVDPAVKTSAFHMALMLTVSIFFFAYNHIGIVGILKSGGDAVFCFIVDTVGVWLISLPLILAAVVLFHAPAEVVFGLSLVEILIKSFFVRHRILDRKWAKNLVDDAEN